MEDLKQASMWFLQPIVVHTALSGIDKYWCAGKYLQCISNQEEVWTCFSLVYAQKSNLHIETER